MKKSWLKASTKTSRAKVEKQNKAIKKLTAARKKAVKSERMEKAARKTANVDSVKCKMARAQATQRMQQNLKMLSQVARGNQKAIKLAGMSEKLSKVTKTKKHFEGRSKAKLQSNLMRERAREAKLKHAGYKSLEKKEKGRKKKADEAKSKACAARVSTMAVF